MSEENVKKKRKMSPNSLKNLRPHHKGEPSFNPKGRPTKDKSLTEAVRREVLETKTGKEPTLKVMAQNIVKKAQKDPRMTKLLWERLEGAVPQPITGELKHDITWIIGKGYAPENEDADDKPGIQTDKQDPK